MATKKKAIKANYPYVENYPPLHEFLQKHNAQCLRQIAVGDRSPDYDYPRSFLETWQIRGNVFIVEVRAEQCGWDIYTSGGFPGIAETLKDAEKRLGVAP
jgi:hypothetical protein